jgi:hypothetical protein
LLCPVVSAPQNFLSLQEPGKAQVSASDPPCQTVRTSQLTITCAYTAEPSVNTGKMAPRIILNRAVISFVPSNESRMHVELTFTNDSASRIADQHAVYLAIDDENGKNHMRRPLADVDFTKLDPHRITKFQETLLAPAFSTGKYIVSIWIPSTDPSMKFDATQNFLLSSKGVPVPTTGLNRIAKFTITISDRQKFQAKPD